MSGCENIAPPTTEYITSKYDREYFLNAGEKSKRFEKLKPEVVHLLFDQRKNFEYVKEVALDRLEKTINDQLEFLTFGDNYDYSHIDKISHNIFHWSRKEFLKRRKIKNPVWIDLVKLQSTKDLLQRLKILRDLNEIKHFVKIIFNALRDKELDDKALEISVWRPIRAAEQYLNMLEILQKDNIDLKERYRELRYQINARLFSTRQSKQIVILRQRELAVLNAQALEPVEMRYKTNWYLGKTDQANVKKSIIEDKLEGKLKKQKFDLELEDECGGNICDVYFALSEQYKSQMTALQARFEYELEAIENTINYTRLQMKKLQDQQQFLTEQIGRFHEEIQEVYDKEEQARREEEEKKVERLRLEQEAALEEERKRKAKLKAAKGKQVGNKTVNIKKAKTKFKK